MTAYRTMSMLTALLLCSAPARAQPSQLPTTETDDPARQRARALLVDGNRKLDQGLYLEALALFEQAYQAFPSPKLHFNIAQTLHMLGRPLEALAHYERFVREVTERDMPEQWALASERIFALHGHIASVSLHVNVSGATVRADGAVVGKSPLVDPLRLLPGTHVVIVGKPGYEQQVIELKLRAGTSVTERVTLLTEGAAIARRREFQRAEAERRAAEQRARNAQAEVVRRRERGRALLRTTGWVALGIGTASVVTATTFGGLSWYEAAQVDNSSEDDAWKDVQPHYERAKTYRLASYGASAVGLAGLTAGIVLMYYGRRDRPEVAPRRAIVVPALLETAPAIGIAGAF